MVATFLIGSKVAGVAIYKLPLLPAICYLPATCYHFATRRIGGQKNPSGQVRGNDHRGTIHPSKPGLFLKGTITNDRNNDPNRPTDTYRNGSR